MSSLPEDVDPSSAAPTVAPAPAEPLPAADAAVVVSVPEEATPASTDAASAVTDAVEASGDAAVAADASDAGTTPAEVPQAKPRTDDLSPAACAAKLAELFPVLFTPPGNDPAATSKPIKLRIHADIQARAPGVFTKRALGIFFSRWTTTTPYLKALVQSPHRFDLDGQPAGEIADEHRQAAVIEIERRRAIAIERRAAQRRLAPPSSGGARHARGGEAARGSAEAAGPDGGPPNMRDERARGRPRRGPHSGPRHGSGPAGDGQQRHGHHGPRDPGSTGENAPRDLPPQDGTAPSPGASVGAVRARPQHDGRRDGVRPDPHRRDASRHDQPRRDGSSGQGQPRRDGPRHNGPRHNGPRHDGPRHDRPRRDHVSRPFGPGGENARGFDAEPALPVDPEQRERAQLLRAFEGSPLSKANFCALKRMTEAELDSKLAQARQERGRG